MSNSNHTDVKSSARGAIEQLPEDAVWDDVMYRIYLRQKIAAGLRDVENGDTVTTEEVRNRFGLSNEGLMDADRAVGILVSPLSEGRSSAWTFSTRWCVAFVGL